jgi:uncharacterized Zn finger protein
MAEKILLNCPGCGSPDVKLVQSDDEEKLYSCEYCGRKWVLPKSGGIVNPEYKKCENCGQVNGPDAKVCQKCGHKIRYECPNCGRLIDLDATFCPYCEIHIQDYLEEEERFTAELLEEERQCRIRNLENQIKDLQTEIDEKEREILDSQKTIDAIQKLGSRLNFFGTAGLSDEEKSIFSRLNGDIGCGTRGIAIVLGLILAGISWQLFIGVSGSQYNNFEPSTFFQNESSSTLYLISCLSLFISLAVFRFVYCFVMMMSRQSKVSSLATREGSRLERPSTEKTKLEKKLNVLKEERG